MIVDTKTEIYNPASNKSCLLPKVLPRNVNGRTFDPPLVCGGRTHSYTVKSCFKFNFGDGSWTKSNDLREVRYAHISWTPSSGEGTYLMGGKYSPLTSEIVNINGVVKNGFNLKHELR